MREELLRFALRMEDVCKKHDRRKGDSWKYMDMRKMWDLLKREYEEVEETWLATEAQDELLDVAIVCMFLWTRLEMKRARA